MKVQSGTLLLLIVFFLNSNAQDTSEVIQDSIIMASEEFQEYYKQQTQHNLLLSTLGARYANTEPAISREEHENLEGENIDLMEGIKKKSSEESLKSRKAIRERFKEDFEQLEKLKQAGSALMKKFPEMSPDKIQELYLIANQKN